MEINCLPTELLELIIYDLPNDDMIRCRRVCKRWKDIVDFQLENIYKSKCELEHEEVYKQAAAKSNLSWADLYNSLNLWSDIKNAQRSTYCTQEDDIHCCQMNDYKNQIPPMTILQNGEVIAFPNHTAIAGRSHRYGCLDYTFDSIVYYNSVDLNIIRSEIFENEFSDYKENEYFYVLKYIDRYLYVIIKANMTTFIVTVSPNGNYLCFGKSVYFVNSDFSINVATLIDDNNGEPKVVTKQITTLMYRRLVAVVVGRNNKTYILCKELLDYEHNYYIGDDGHLDYTTRVHIYCLRDEENLELECSIPTTLKYFEALDVLRKYGFNVYDEKISILFLRHKGYDMVLHEISQLSNPIIFRYGKVVIVGTCRHTLHIYYNPFRNGKLNIKYKKPTLHLNLLDLFNFGKDYYAPCSYKSISKIDVIEIKNGHRIVVLAFSNILIIEMIHKSMNEPKSDLKRHREETQPSITGDNVKMIRVSI